MKSLRKKIKNKRNPNKPRVYTQKQLQEAIERLKGDK